MQKSGGKIKVFLREIAPYVSIIQPFQILNGRFQNLLNKALRKSWMLGFFFLSNYPIYIRQTNKEHTI